MILSLDQLASMIDEDISIILDNETFRAWPYERFYENNLIEPLVDYTFPRHGIDIVCNRNEEIKTIFLYFDELRESAVAIKELLPSFAHKDVIQFLGEPEKSGSKFIDPILGNCGAWDRFQFVDHVVHIEYDFDLDTLRKITFMSKDTAP